LSLPSYTSQRRDALLRLYVQLQRRIQELDGQVEKEVQQRPQALRLLTHPGVGPVTALATEVFLGDPGRFANGKNLASYIGMIPCEHTGGKRHLRKRGRMSVKQAWQRAWNLHKNQIYWDAKAQCFRLSKD
jgi:transposase